MKTFSGKYYTGTSSKTHLCNVKIERGALLISINDPASEILWNIDEISRDDINFNHIIRLRYGKFPYQSLEVEDKDFFPTINKYYPKATFTKEDFVSKASKSWKWIISLFLALIGLAVFLFVVVVPNLGEYAATKVSPRVERAIGESAYNQISSTTSEHRTKSRLAQEFFENMDFPRKYDYEIVVLNSKMVNAFAVPGGKIAVYNGILNKLNNQEEFAALLAHECAHVELQHSIKSLFRTLSSYFFIGLLFGDTGGMTAVVYENMYVFQNLQYSRKMEKEADMQGIKYLEKAVINPEGMLGLFNSLKEEESKSGVKEYSEFLSTHPLTNHRINYIEEYIKEKPVGYTKNYLLDSLWNEIKNLN